jgi:hypothetical protein
MINTIFNKNGTAFSKMVRFIPLGCKPSGTELPYKYIFIVMIIVTQG